MPFPLRFPLAFDGKLLGQVLRIFTDTVAGWYRKRHVARGLPDGETGAVTAIQRANSDLRPASKRQPIRIVLDPDDRPDQLGKTRLSMISPRTQPERSVVVVAVVLVVDVAVADGDPPAMATTFSGYRGITVQRLSLTFSSIKLLIYPVVSIAKLRR